MIFAPKSRRSSASTRRRRPARTPGPASRHLLPGQQHHHRGPVRTEGHRNADEGQRHAACRGDNTAYSALVSRYMMAVEHQHGGLSMDTAEAGLRTACT